MSAPMLDSRTFDELRTAVHAAAARTVPEWQPGLGDAGDALVAVFAHYLEVLLERLNRAPDKNLVAFFDALGVGFLPPGAAVAPVTFTPAPTAAAASLVAAGTQVATQQTETSPAVVYETQTDLALTVAQLDAAYTVDPVADRWADQIEGVGGAAGIVFRPFAGDRRLDHALYLGLPAGRPLLEATGGTLDILTEPAGGGLASLRWQVWRQGMWQDLDASVASTGRYARSAARTIGSAASLTKVSEEARGPDIHELTESGLVPAPTARWLRALPAGALTEADTAATANLAVIGVLAGMSDATYVEADGSDVYFAGHAGLAPERKRIHLRLEIHKPQLPDSWRKLLVEWSAYDGAQWLPFGNVTITRSVEEIVEDGLTDTTRGLQRSGWISFDRPATLALATPGGRRKAYWLRAETKILPDGDFVKRPKVRRARLSRELPVDAAVVGTAAADTTAGFLPFGAQPATGDVVYLASGEVLAQAGAQVHLFVTLAAPGVPAPSPPVALPTAGPFELVWEYHGAAGWTRLGSTTVEFTVSKTSNTTTPQPTVPALRATRARVRVSGIHDSTEGLSRSGEVVFALPDDVADTDVAGTRSYWVRARIAQGGYGTPPVYVPKFLPNARTPAPFFELVPGTGTLAAPRIGSVTAAYVVRTPILPQVVVRNGFAAEDRSAANQAATLVEPLLDRVEEDVATFYVGFDRALPNDAVTLYFAALPRELVEALPHRGRSQGTAETELAWEYWNGLAWVPLVVFDGTRNLSEPGVVEFLAAEDLAPVARVDQTPRWWIRVREVASGTDYDPLLAGLYLNTVEVVQASTIAGEVLGSSTGGLGQRFHFSRAPVFPGQRVLVREPELPPAPEREQLESEEGSDAVAVRPAAPRDEIWIRWHEVETLFRSGPRSRHYTVERNSGELRFGDGIHGLVPPVGVDNVVCARYRAGGSAAGNRPAGAIDQLKTSIPYVAEVSNPLPADGGSGSETLGAAVARGGRTVRNRHRAVSAADFESLAREASGTEIVRARTLANRDAELAYHPGWVTVVIVPEGTARRLLPTPELVKKVGAALTGSSLATLGLQSPDRINVVGPGYVPVQLRAELRPVDFTRAEAVRKAALAAFDGFLHPLTGGPEGTGWEFGRDVYLSELFAVLEGLPDVDHVHSLAFEANVAMLPLVPSVAFTPTAAAAVGDELTWAPSPGTVAAVLVEPLPAGVATDVVMVTLFREGEEVDVGGVRTTVRTVTGATLAVDPFRARDALPAGTVVAATRSGAGSYLTTGVAAGDLVTQLSVANFVPGAQVTLGDDTFMLRKKHPALTLGERVVVPSFSLPYSSVHTVEITQS